MCTARFSDWRVLATEIPWTETPPEQRSLLDRDPWIWTPPPPKEHGTKDRDPSEGIWDHAARQEVTSYRDPL